MEKSFYTLFSISSKIPEKTIESDDFAAGVLLRLGVT